MLVAWVRLLQQFRAHSDPNVIIITGTARASTTGGHVGKFDAHASAAGTEARLTQNAKRPALRIFDDERRGEGTPGFAWGPVQGPPLAVRLVKKLICRSRTSGPGAALDTIASARTFHDD